MPDRVIGHLLESVVYGVIVWSPDNRVKAFNSCFFEMVGLDEAEIGVGSELADVLTIMHRRNDPQSSEAEVARIVAQRLAVWGTDADGYEERHMPNGRVLDILRSRTSDGDLLCIHIDVTERFQRERELEQHRVYMNSILDNISDGVNLIDAEERFIAFNQRFLEFYDVDPAAVYWGIPYDELATHFGDLRGLSAERQAEEVARRREFAFNPDKARVIRNLFNGRTLEIIKTQLPTGGCVMTLRDITQELNVRRNLEEERRRAEDANVTKSRFLARMSHEMRTPLNGILGMIALAEQGAEDDRQREFLNVIRSSGLLLLRLIDDVLDMTRVESETYDLIEEPFSVPDLLNRVMKLAEMQATEKGLSLILEQPLDHMPLVLGDSVRLKQVLMNLVTNAIKFTESGSVTIRLDGAIGDDAVAFSVSVSDTGIGISERDQREIFKQFYQVEDRETRRHGGLGLGLAISDKLVQSMGGSLEVSSKLGEGSCFTVNLKLHHILAGDQAVSQAARN